MKCRRSESMSDRSSWRCGETATTMIPMLSINDVVGRQSAKIRVFVAMLLTAVDSAFGGSPNTGVSLASSPASTPSTLAPSTYSSCQVDGPYIAMTFDDGPRVGNTTRLLDILKEPNIKVTFFMIGSNVVAHPEIARRALAEGHEIGNHSWTHPELSKLSDQRVTEEITRTQEAIKNATGFTPTILRPPYGAITKDQREWIESQLRLSVILWSVDPFDWKRPGASVITERILRGAQSGAIILSHDIHKETVDAMPATLDALLTKGYKFVTVSELIAINHPQPPSSSATVSGTSEN
jgi:peptidoglycan-N-acetylglucosamine deacetylase